MKSQDIKAVSYVHMGDKLASTQELNAAQQKQLGAWVKTTYLNALFQGQAVFSSAGSNPTSNPKS